MKRLSWFVLTLGISSTASAMDMRLDETQNRSFLSASGEYSQFNLDEGAGKIAGSGLKIDFTHAFSEKTSLEMYLASALNTSGGSSFTGLGGYMFYNIFGNCCVSQRVVYIDGKPLISESSRKGQSLQVGAGLDQFFLNGSKSVYSSSGVGVAAVYQFALFNYNFKAEARQSQMTAGKTKIQGSFFSLGLTFAL